MPVYARRLAAQAGWPVIDRPPMAAAGCDLHLHFTERIWGATPAEAAEAIAALAAHHRVSVTLHDLPQASDGRASLIRRRAAYRTVVGAANGVICNSHWERRLLHEALDGRSIRAALAVIPLGVEPVEPDEPDEPVESDEAVEPAEPLEPVEPVGPVEPDGRVDPGEPFADAPARTTAPTAAGPTPSIGLLGYVYPGKGHAEAIRAAAELTSDGHPPVRVVALGGVSAGHAEDAVALAALAQRLGVDFSITGYLPDADLHAAARLITIPLAAHQHISASASINTWTALGRRPLVVDSPYAEEMDALRPGTLRRYAPDTLARAIAITLSDPTRTRLGPEIPRAPGLSDAARAYERFWTTLSVR